MYDINKIESKISVIERLAMDGKELPKGYTQPEQLLFLSLRVLHWEYRHRQITLEQAKKEKERLAREYVQSARFQVMYQQAVEVRNHMGQYLMMATKGTCPVCRKLVEIFEGRERDVQNLKNKEAILSYQTRLKCYEAEKRELLEKAVTPREYERRIQEIARKWRI